MIIGIDISPLLTGHSARGTGSYTKQLLHGLEQFASDVKITTYTEKDQIPNNVDLLHIPFFDPYFLTLRFSRSLPVVVTVHDLIPIVYKRYMPSGIRAALKWQVQKNKLKQVNHIITDSKASKRDIVEMLKCKDEKVTAIYLSAGEQFKPQPVSEQERVLKKYRLPDQYLLYVGDVNWNKNIPKMIEACKDLKLPLVLVGKVFLNKELAEIQEIETIIAKNNLEQQIIRTGYVAEEDLPSIYSAARLTLQVSIAEGFGLPVLESMACGTPCVVSTSSSLGEIAGPSVTVDPWNRESISAGIVKALSLNRAEQSKLALAWSHQFTLKKMITETVTVYKDVLSS